MYELFPCMYSCSLDAAHTAFYQRLGLVLVSSLDVQCCHSTAVNGLQCVAVWCSVCSEFSGYSAYLLSETTPRASHL